MKTIAMLLPAFLLVTTARAAEQHPRLFLTPARVKQIQEQAKIDGSHHQVVLADLKARWEKTDAGGAGEGYAPGYRAVEAAFLSAVADNEADRQKYAAEAYKALAGWTKTGSATLGKSMEGRCLAFAYDWAWPAWTEEQRATMRKRVDAVLASLGAVSHSNLGGDRSSNFVGVIRGAELLLQLASGADVKSERCAMLVGELRRYFDSFGDIGASQEGPGYTEYPAPFAFGAALAAQQCGDATLVDAITKRHAFWKLVMYTRVAGPQTNLGLQWGVGGGADYTEGWSSQLFAVCPAEHLPAYLWWYDRSVGRLTPATMTRRFDADRHGTVWALIYYPVGVTAQDPTGTFPPAVADSRGYLFFRNHWQDGGTILASLTAQVHKDEKGWNQPEQLAINLIASGQRFIGGPAKDTKPEAYSSLLVDGKYTYKDATERMGKVVAFEAGKDGGYAIVQGGQMYEKLGVKEATRHMLVNFRPGNQAIIATLDRVKSATEHSYTWQANTGVAVEAGKEAGRPFFLLKGSDSAFVKGWVMFPATAEVSAGRPLRVTVKGADADLAVVMFVGQGQPPTATVAGEGPSSTLTVAGNTVKFDAGKERLQCGP